MTRLSQKDVLRADQFSREELELILATATAYEQALAVGEPLHDLRGRILSTLFFEPSTRTRLSFEAAMLRLGGGVLSVAEAKSSSAAKGESLEDTIRTVEGYADVIVLRHPEVGAAARAAAATEKPVLNAGDGAGEHPTQALLDLFTIRKERTRIEGLTVALEGDLRHGRTVHSLARLLALYDVRLILVSPEELRMPPDVLERIAASGVEVVESTDLRSAIPQADVLYMTRIQRERFATPSEYERLKDSYVLTREMLAAGDSSLLVLHPLPRVNEIAADVDDFQGAAYFRQAANGVPVRMALLALVCGIPRATTASP